MSTPQMMPAISQLSTSDKLKYTDYNILHDLKAILKHVDIEKKRPKVLTNFIGKKARTIMQNAINNKKLKSAINPEYLSKKRAAELGRSQRRRRRKRTPRRGGGKK